MAGSKTQQHQQIIFISSSDEEASEEDETGEDDDYKDETCEVSSNTDDDEDPPDEDDDEEDPSDEDDDEEDPSDDEDQDDCDMSDDEEEGGEENEDGKSGVPKTASRHAKKIKIKLPSADKNNADYYQEAVHMIAGGDMSMLNLEHCKSYLRFHSLRVSGSREILLKRIEEHFELKHGGGMARYPRSTFRINCTGDACTGDVVLFKQNVYEGYDKVTRSSVRAPLGIREIAGRIVKDSYGVKKQQHTFTIEVLWSAGPKALPPLYPLLVKGRNLYRLKTSRQAWPNEADRKRALKEKHTRGSVSRIARLDRLVNKKRRSDQRASKAGKAQQIEKTRIKVEATKYVRESGQKRVRVDSFASSSRKKRACGGTEVAENSHAGSTVRMRVSSVGVVIGKRGKNIKKITSVSGAKITVGNNGLVEISGRPEQVEIAKEMVSRRLENADLTPRGRVKPAKQTKHPNDHKALGKHPSAQNPRGAHKYRKH